MAARGGVEGPARRWWAGLRILVLALWLVAAAAAWWTAPRQASYADARADIATRHVVAWQWGDRWDDGGGGARRWFAGSELRSSGPHGPLFAWRTADGRVHWTDTAEFGEVTLTGVVNAADYAGEGATGIAQDLLAKSLETRTGELWPARPWIGALGLFLGIVFLAVLVAGPAPALGTRWYWFWLILITPYALGLVFWTLRDRPWTRVAAPRPWTDPSAGFMATATGTRRDRWWKTADQARDRGLLGLLTGILASLLISVVLLLLHAVLGAWLIPS